MRFPRMISALLLTLALSVSVCFAADSIPEIKVNVHEFTLDNGMLFLVVERHASPQVACRLAIRAGSALEDSGKTGIAHLLEHMMFKGTKNFGTTDPEKDQELQQKIEDAYQTILAEQEKRDPDEALIEEKRKEMDALRLQVQKIYVPQAFSSQLGKNGAVNINAFTTEDQTQFTASVPSDMVEQWFSIISEQIFEPAWREFYVEKEVVQREWAFRYINNPAGAAWLDLSATAYTAHPYRNPTIGWKSDMKRFNTRDAMAFHKRFYNPTDAVCVLVGDITPDKAKKFAEIYFSRYPAGPRAPEIVTEEPKQQGPRKSVRVLKGARTPLVLVGFHAAKMGTDDFYALDALTMILSHGQSARMDQNLVNKGLAVQAWSANPDNRYGGMFIVGGSPNEPEAFKKLSNDLTEEQQYQAYLESCEKLEDLLLAEVENIKENPVSQQDLDRIKKLNERDYIDRLRSNEELAQTLASLEVQVGWPYFATYLQKIGEVTPEDVQRVANKYISRENRTSVYVIPGGAPDSPPEEYSEIRSAGVSSQTNLPTPDLNINRSEYPTPKGWKHPLSFSRHPEKIPYPNAETATIGDATVFYLPDRELPIIDLALLVKAGEVDVPDSMTGLTSLLNGTLVLGGTEVHTPSEFAMILDENAIHLSVSVGDEEATIRLSVLKEDWDKGLALLEELLSRPIFDETVLYSMKNRFVVALQRQGGDADAVASREANIWHFKGHPYGRDPLFGILTIPSITKADLKAFLSNFFVPSNTTVAVSGDIDKAKAVDGIEKLFQALPDKEAPPRDLAFPPPTRPVLALINKPGQVQSQIAVRLPGLLRTNENYWKLNLLMNIFGGSDSLVYRRLRDDLGLVYSAVFYETYKWKAGILAGYIGCKADKTAEAIRETVKIMDALRIEVPKDELELKRKDVLNSFVFNVDTPAQLVEVYARYHMRNEPLDTLERIQDSYIGATQDELETIAQKMLDPTKLQIFVVADKTVIGTKGIPLGEELGLLSKEIGIAFAELPLR